MAHSDYINLYISPQYDNYTYDDYLDDCEYGGRTPQSETSEEFENWVYDCLSFYYENGEDIDGVRYAMQRFIQIRFHLDKEAEDIDLINYSIYAISSNYGWNNRGATSKIINMDEIMTLFTGVEDYEIYTDKDFSELSFILRDHDGTSRFDIIFMRAEYLDENIENISIWEILDHEAYDIGDADQLNNLLSHAIETGDQDQLINDISQAYSNLRYQLSNKGA